MSKAKKIISMLLAVAMVLSVAPMSLSASAATITEPSPSFTFQQFSVDTSATTKVLRVAASAGSFSLGDQVVPATASGIPQNGGTYASIAYAGETPSAPKVVFTISGASLAETPSIKSSLTVCSFKAVQRTNNPDGSTTYTWEIETATATAGTDVTFTITYKVGNTTYEAYAFSHCENILVMNGFLSYKTKTSGTNNKNRHSLIVQLQSRNMYSGMCQDSQVSNRTVGYINYATTNPAETNNLVGCGSGTDLSSAVNAYGSAAPNGAIIGDEQGVMIKSVESTSGTQRNMCYNNDTNKSESVVYMDRRTDKSLRDLNMRMTVQNGERTEFSSAYVGNIAFYSGHKTFGSDEGGFTSDAAAAAIMSASGIGSGNQITSSDVYGYITLPFSGTGPTATSDSEQQYSMIVDLWSNQSTSYASKAAGGINLDFYVYDTSDLYGMYMGALRGTGSYTCTTSAYAGTVIDFNKGVNPQASMYTNGWSAYEAAMKEAGRILATPDVKQSQVDAAALNLYAAYNALEGYYEESVFKVHYMNNGELDASGNPVHLTKADGSEAIYSYNKPSGTTIIVSPTNVAGYSVTDNSPKSEYASGKAAKTEIGSDGITRAVVDIYFYYNPSNYNLNLYTGTDAGVKIVQYPFDQTVNTYTTSTEVINGKTYTNYTSLLETGTKANYSFAGWYKDQSYSESAQSFKMPAAATTIFAKWVPTPIKINAIPVVDGQQLDAVEIDRVTPSEDPTISTPFARPADLNLTGYLFVEYFEDAELTTPVTWPLRFSIGDADKTIYARMVDVNGKIIFESNGGTAVPDKSFNAPANVDAPDTIPTKKGYTFAGWYKDKELTELITWPVTMNNATGFIAYAAWTAEEHTISFNIGSAITKYDTVAIAPIKGAAGSLIENEFYPNEPLKFGYVFDGWSLNGTRYAFDGTNTYPTEDITLTALWRTSDHSAFADITAFEKLSGKYVETQKASVGDVVTFRMSAMTNFYSGSSVFVFMYDTNFFELVEEGSKAFVVNRDNEYISGIDAKINGVTDSSVLPWPSGLDNTNYKAMMITIDPTITMDNYNCEPMADGEWLVEFQLKVKDTATGSGTVYMDNAWTRTQDNIMGTQFISWADSDDASVADTYNNVVTPNLDAATATITLDEVIPEDTNLTLWANADNEATASKGAWIEADGTAVSSKTYTGRAGTEIADFVEPTREGYELTGWYYQADESVKLGEAAGYYASEEIKDRIYIAEWSPLEYTINYYTEKTDGALHYSEQVGYETNPEGPAEAPTKTGYVFDKWVDDAGNEVDFATYTCPLNGANLYATWAPADDTAYTLRITYLNNLNGSYTSTSVAMKGTTDATVMIVDAVPDVPAENTIYVTTAELPTVANGNYNYDPSKNTLPISAVIAADGTTVIELNYVAKPITFTYDANGGKFSDGSLTKDETKPWQSYAEGPGEDPVRDGYVFAGWQGVTLGTTRMAANGVKKANWTAKKYPVTFDANGGKWSDGALTQSAEYVSGATIAAPATNPAKDGYNFLGWAASATADKAESLGTMDATNDEGKTFYAVYALAEYTVTYNVDGEQTYVDTYHLGDTVTVRGEELKTGYTFSGWKNNGVDAGTSFTMGAENVVLEGVFTPDSFDVIFDAKGGYFDGDKEATTKAVPTLFDDAITPPAPPARNGYKFLGWAASEGSTDIVTNYGYLTTTDTVTFYALWEATVAEYIINVYYQDATGAYSGEPVTTTSSGLVATTATVSHETWAKTGFSADIEESVLSGIISAETPLVLEVYYSRNQYALSTNVDGVVTKIADYYYEAAVAEPAAPENKTGYTFAGWSGYTEGMTMPAADTTLTATWKINSHVVTWDVDGTKTTATYEYGATITAPADPSKTGYTFTGWEGFTAGDTMGDADITYTAKWDINSYTITYRTYNGVYKTDTVEYGAEIVLPDEPAREGYTFTGWDGYTEGMTMPAQQQVFIAQWSINSYTVTWDVDGKTTEETYAYGATINKPATPEKEGYTFAGWSPEVPATQGAADATYTATWTVNSYTVTWDVDGKTTEETYAYGANINKPADPEKEGHTFAGWSPEVPATQGAANATYTATWTVNEYNVTWDVDGATTTEKVAYGAAVNKPADPEKEGHTFAGWTPAVPATQGAADATYTATWTTNSYNLTWVIDGATFEGPTSTAYGTEIVAPVPTKTGYTFSGWNGIPADGKMPAGDLTVTGSWIAKDDIVYKIETYIMDTEGAYGDPSVETKAGTTDSNVTVVPEEKVGFTVEEGSILGGIVAADGSLVLEVYYARNQYALSTNVDGTVTKVDDYYYEATVAEPAAPENKEGHTFAGWDGYTEGMTMPAADTTVTATWTVNDYTVTWDVDGKTTEETYAYGATINKPADPEKEGYTFAGWSPEVPATQGAADATYTATWTVNNYTVTWDVDGKTTEETYAYGANINKPADPEKEGYTFTGWSPEVPATQGAANATYTATWQVNQYTITFANTGDTVIEAIKADYGTAISKPADPTWTGYTFRGWDVTIPDTMPAGDMTITGNWTANAYTIEWMVDDKLVSADTYDFGATINAPTDPAKDGYTFNGWSWAKKADSSAVSASATMPAYDVVATAQWIANSDTAYSVEIYKMAVDGATYEKVDTVEGLAGETDSTATYAVAAETGFTVNAEMTTGYDVEAGTASAKIAGNGSTVIKVYYNRNAYEFTINGVTDDYYYGEEITEPAKPTAPEGHEQDGWVDENGEAVEFPLTVGVDNPTTIAPNYKKLSYDIVWTIDGETTTQTYEFDAAVTAPEIPAKTGYRVVGWIDAAGKLAKIPATMPAQKLVYTALYETLVYGVNYFVDGKIVSTVSAEYGETIQSINYAAPTGYTFDGWYTNKEMTEKLTADAIVTAKETNIYGKTTANTYEAVFMVDGEVYETVKAVFDTKIVAPDAPTKDGYIFAGWTPNVEIMDEEGKIFNATWEEEANAYSVTYKMGTEDDAATYEVFKYAIGEEIELPADPYKEGHTFAGWVDAEGNEAEIAKTMPAENLTYYASWIVGGYTITWVADETSDVDAYEFGAAVKTPEDPTKEGHTFAGWVDAEGEAAEIPGTMPAEDLTFYASWTVNNYTVTWDVDGKTTEETYAYGANINKPADPEKEGYTFAGWSPEVPATQGAADATYTAQWTVNSYTITWIVDGEEDVDTYEFGATVTVPEDPAKEGFEFAGWVDSEGEAAEIPGTMPAEDLTFTATWTEVAAKIPVKLVPVEGSTTMIERAGTIESYNDGYTVNTEEYGYESGEEDSDFYDEWYIYGLKVNFRERDIASYFTVQGDGRMEVDTTLSNGGYGTGVKIKVYNQNGTPDDTSDDTFVEQFYIVIFGDVDGNARVNSTDTTMILDDVLAKDWSNNRTGIAYMKKAASIDGNTRVSSYDATLHGDVVLRVLALDQVTGTTA